MTLLPGLWLLTSSSILRFIGEGNSSTDALFCPDRSLFCPALDAPLTASLARLQLLQCLDRFQRRFFLACSFLLCRVAESAPDLFAALHALGDDLTCHGQPALSAAASASASEQSPSQQSQSPSQLSQSQQSQQLPQTQLHVVPREEGKRGVSPHRRLVKEDEEYKEEASGEEETGRRKRGRPVRRRRTNDA